MRGNVEAFFLAGQHRRPAACPASTRAAHTSGCRRCILSDSGSDAGELDDAMVEERRPHFQRVGHAHAIALIRGCRRPGSSAGRARETGSASPTWNASVGNVFISCRVRIRCGRVQATSLRSENVPFQKRCASSGGSSEPARNRLALYSKLIFSSETGHRLSGRSPARRSHAGDARAAAAPDRRRGTCSSRRTVRRRLRR